MTNQSVAEKFESLQLLETIKPAKNHNPLMTQRLGADPYAIVYNNRVYMYMTGDFPEYDENGNVKPNTYSKIHTLNVLSSDDLVNWTDHGSILAASEEGAAKWGNNSWAPAACHKEIDGKTKFFIYFANGGNGIGVITSDSPTGPFVDPLGHALISRETPNCANVEWLFDPAVLVDDDGRAYLYFGGGVPEGKCEHPGTGRVVELGEDMISIKGEPQAFEIPFLFEDSGINKINGTYYYSYCSNFSLTDEGRKKYGFSDGQIITMTSKNPMGPYTLQGPILKNPGDFFGVAGNNHHCMFQFNGKYYMAYHSQMLENVTPVKGGYRSTNINEVHIDENGKIQDIAADAKGVAQVKAVNPFKVQSAVMMSTMAGIDTAPADEQTKQCGSGTMELCVDKAGSWIMVEGVDFGNSAAQKISMKVKASQDLEGYVQIRKDSLDGEVVGYVQIPQGNPEAVVEVTAELDQAITSLHDLYFIFAGSGYRIQSYIFE